MATTKQVIEKNTGITRSRQFRKSPKTTAVFMAKKGVFGKTVARRKSLGGSGG